MTLERGYIYVKNQWRQRAYHTGLDHKRTRGETEVSKSSN